MTGCALTKWAVVLILASYRGRRSGPLAVAKQSSHNLAAPAQMHRNDALDRRMFAISEMAVVVDNARVHRLSPVRGSLQKGWSAPTPRRKVVRPPCRWSSEPCNRKGTDAPCRSPTRYSYATMQIEARKLFHDLNKSIAEILDEVSILDLEDEDDDEEEMSTSP